MELSRKANKIAAWMLKELSQLKYAYKQTIESCYDEAINYYGFPKPEVDEKDAIVQKVTQILNETCKTIGR